MERSTLELTHWKSAMHKHKWDARTKALIVIEGLKGQPAAKICHEHQIKPSQYYQGRDQCLANAAQAFESHQHTRQEVRLAHENTQLKRFVGDHAGLRCTATHGLEALEMADHGPCPNGARGQSLSLMCENGCQPPAIALLEACNTLEIQHACTSDNPPKGHTDTERVMRTLTDECLWCKEWTCPLTWITALAAWITT